MRPGAVGSLHPGRWGGICGRGRTVPKQNGWHKTVGRPARHLGWVYSGPAQLEGRASTFLAEGVGRGERLIFVADNPNVKQWPAAFLRRGDLRILSTCEIYGKDRIVDAGAVRSRCEAQLAEALRDGYTGLRVVAENTTLIDGPERLAAWMRWEDEVERFIAGNPVTGLCAFDRSRTDAEVLRKVVGLHRAVAPPAA